MAVVEIRGLETEAHRVESCRLEPLADFGGESADVHGVGRVQAEIKLLFRDGVEHGPEPAVRIHEQGVVVKGEIADAAVVFHHDGRKD